LLPCAVDRVALGVQEVLHQQDQLDLATLIRPVPRARLGRREKAELALPVAEDVRLEIRERTDLADGEKLLDRLAARRHQSCSPRRSRDIRERSALPGDAPSKRIPCTAAMIGISTPRAWASACALCAVGTPSATVSRPS